jgi:folate-dependent tRNA-U54 methylase TrmFO/GidA
MEEGEYNQFVSSLNQAEKMPVHQFEKKYLFDCLDFYAVFTYLFSHPISKKTPQ